MNMAQWLLSIGMSPPSLKPIGLAAPVINTNGQSREVWDGELGGSVPVPVKTTKAKEKPPCQ